ncbi:MAG: phosphotransferase family protein [Acidimicrobiales bacterium]
MNSTTEGPSPEASGTPEVALSPSDTDSRPREVEGIDANRVTAWFVENIPGVQPPLRFDLIAGGRSNLTFRVRDAGGNDYVLRRPPISHVLPTAHDMSREFRIISSLGPTSVPVAPALGLCEDEEVNQRPFYVMGHVNGHVLRDPATVEKVLDPHQRGQASKSIIDVLARIHAVDPDGVGLGQLGRRDSYIERQLKRWYGQFTKSQTETGRHVPLIDELFETLSSRIPEQGSPAIVHGDYRLDNTMFDDQGNILAVLDWEICTLGDPLADLGLLMVYWTEAGDERSALGVAPTALPGFWTRDDLMKRYTETTGRDVSNLDFYVAFGYWKLACIVEGVYSRYAGGAKGGDRTDHEVFAAQVETLARAAEEAIDRSR